MAPHRHLEDMEWLEIIAKVEYDWVFLKAYS